MGKLFSLEGKVALDNALEAYAKCGIDAICLLIISAIAGVKGS